MKINIQSISSVITNSSSEIYTIFTEKGITVLKESINALLKAAGSDKTVDDLFEISLCADDWFVDSVLDCPEDYGFDHEPNDEELLELAIHHDNNTYDIPAVGIYYKSRNKDLNNTDLYNLIDGCFNKAEFYT